MKLRYLHYAALCGTRCERNRAQYLRLHESSSDWKQKQRSTHLDSRCKSCRSADRALISRDEPCFFIFSASSKTSINRTAKFLSFAGKMMLHYSSQTWRRGAMTTTSCHLWRQPRPTKRTKSLGKRHLQRTEQRFCRKSILTLPR